MFNVKFMFKTKPTLNVILSTSYYMTKSYTHILKPKSFYKLSADQRFSNVSN